MKKLVARIHRMLTTWTLGAGFALLYLVIMVGCTNIYSPIEKARFFYCWVVVVLFLKIVHVFKG